MKFVQTTLLTLLTTMLCGAALYGQTVVLDEDFSSGVPPTGWIHENVNGNTSAGWVPDGGGRAWHEDYAGATTINRLVSPSFSLAGMTQAFLHFEGETNYATYLANHPNSTGDGISNFEISTDGGVTWTVVWTDTSQANGSYGPSLSLNTYLGQTNVQVGVYFYGTFAQEWWVDNVIVDDTPVAVIDTWVNPANQHPYYLIGETDWASAQAMATSLGGALVSISDAAENAWVRSHAGNIDCWIGINDIDAEGSSAWISGEPVLYTNWAAGDPSTGTLGQSEDYGLMYGSNGTWADFDSNRTARGMVEISEPVLAYESLVAGQLSTIACAGLKIGSRVVFVFSPNGAGPTNTSFGILDVDMDFVSPLFWARNGRFEFTTVVPLSLAGSTLYGQCIALNADNSTELSNSMAVPVN
ncbi:MAG: hypothetical protein GY879_11230 [Planctomycetes bacterium]|nr:hypothetical protein [Planctomycetota bacterium]MCP4860381.1 hypothetical protein [Planctomycetota bacterium]